jgi:hypothetical protein
LPPPPIVCFLGEAPFNIQRNWIPISLKQKSVIYYLWHNLKKNESGRDFQREIWNDRSQKQKKNYGSHRVFFNIRQYQTEPDRCFLVSQYQKLSQYQNLI